MSRPPTFGVLGAGAVGCFVGGRLLAAGRDVAFLGRAGLGDEIRTHGLALVDLDGSRVRLAPERVSYRTEPDAFADRDVVLVTVKSPDTETAARAIAPHLCDSAIVVSFQNGVGNVERLRAALPGRTVLSGMVFFNVVRRECAVFVRATDGGLALERQDSVDVPIVISLREAGFATERRRDMDRVLFSKLLFNLNNALNALSGLPLAEQLADRGARRRLASAMTEGLAVMRAAGIRPVWLGRIHPALAARVMPLPNPIFRVLARSMLRIDPAARSSMSDDLARGRPTEIDFLNGEVARLGRALGVPTPINDRIVAEIRDLVARSPRR